MNGIEITQLTGIINAVRPDSPRREYEIARDQQNHNFVDMFLNTKLRKRGNGPSIDRMIVLDKSGNVEWRLPYQRSSTNVKQLQKRLNVGWVHISNSWGMDVFEAMTMQGDAEVLADELDARRTKCYEELYDEMDDKGWDAPDYDGDPYGPLGFPYWLCMAPSGFDDDEPSFNGYTVRYGDGTTGTSRGGIDGATYPNYRNLTFTWSSINEAFVQSLRDCIRLQSFEKITIPGGSEASGFNDKATPQYEMFMGGSPYRDLERFMAARYDEYRQDLDPQGGGSKLRFRQIPFNWTKPLDDNTYNPIFGVNKKKFRPYVMLNKGGGFLHESEPMTDMNQHTVSVVKLDAYFQMLAENPREAGFCAHNPIS